MEKKGRGRRLPTPLVCISSRRREKVETVKQPKARRERDPTPNLLLKRPDATLATYVSRQMKHAFETLAKHLKTIVKQNNIHIKQLQRMCEIYNI
jgi:hypothetical protein